MYSTICLALALALTAELSFLQTDDTTIVPAFLSLPVIFFINAKFISPVSEIDVSEEALRGVKFGQRSVGGSYPLASTYEYTKCTSWCFSFHFMQLLSNKIYLSHNSLLQFVY
jgi:hypothetical protein